LGEELRGEVPDIGRFLGQFPLLCPTRPGSGGEGLANETEWFRDVLVMHYGIA